jgi:hypothetical protein
MTMAKPKKVWVEQAVVVKKSHPFASSKGDARRIAEHHAKDGVTTIVESPASFRVIRRAKNCFRTFRSQKRGNHVTVVWGKLKKGAKRSCK